MDVSTLRATLAELRAYRVHISHVLIDAGYYSEANIRLLYGEDDKNDGVVGEAVFVYYAVGCEFKVV